MKIRVRGGYTFFYKNIPYTEGSILEVKEEDIINQSWKVEVIKDTDEKVETKTVDSSISKNRMIKKKDITKK